jgi:AmiR/NasT family two-component response regulator
MKSHEPERPYEAIDVATGVLIYQCSCDADSAFERLLVLALQRQERLEQTANLIVTLSEVGCRLWDNAMSE